MYANRSERIFGGTVRVYFVLTVCALAMLLPGWRHERSESHRQRFLMKRSSFTWGGVFAWGWSDSLRDGACGGPLKRDALSIPSGDLIGIGL